MVAVVMEPRYCSRPVYMSSNDPNFEQKAADIIGLYLNPAARERCLLDEKTGFKPSIVTRVLSPGRAERHGRVLDGTACAHGVQYEDREDRQDRGAAHLGAVRSGHRGASADSP